MRRLSILRRAQRAEPVARATLSTASRATRPALIASGAALCVLLLPAMYPPSLRLVWNVSASVPVGLYRILPAGVPRRGEVVAVRPSPSLSRFMATRRYVEAGALLMKPVAAAAGQQVCRAGAIVTIDGVLVATARAADHAKRLLPVWTGCYRLRADTVFLLAPLVPASFDGRYFGPVASSRIVGRAVPLWTWQ